MPTRMEYIGAYAKGWTEGDAQAILEACAPDYFIDDPRQPHKVTRDEFGAYLKDLVEEATEEAGGKPGDPFMAITDVLVQADHALVSCWWHIPGLGISGAGLIRVGDRGVESEKIAYYG